MRTQLRPRPHQVDALADLARAAAVHDRVQLVMACGTGKTLVGRWHAEASAAHRVVVFVPSLALVAQTLAEWRRPGRTWPFRSLVVCSDPSTAAGQAERSEAVDVVDADGAGTGSAGVGAETWEHLRTDVTTDPQMVARFLEEPDQTRPLVVFSTYHSAPVVAAAQSSGAGALTSRSAMKRTGSPVRRLKPSRRCCVHAPWWPASGCS